MKIYVDADACPVKNIIVSEAEKRNIEVIMVCDTSHILNDGFSRVVTVDKEANSADMVLVNMVNKNDIVVTQDFGVAAMALSKKASVINQNGLVYSNENMDRLLFERFLAAKSRRAGNRTKNSGKRTEQDNENFKKSFLKLLER